MEEQQHPPGRTTRRSFRGFFMVVLVGFLIIAAGVPPFGLHEALASEQKPLLFLSDKDYPPITYLDGGVAKGVEVDLAKALAKPMGRTIQIELMDWRLAQEKVLRGEADGLLAMSMSEERMRLFDFSDPTFTHEFGLFVRSGDLTIHGPSDLTGKSVGVTPGGMPRKLLQPDPGIHLVLIESYKDGFDRLTTGSIDAVAADRWVAAYTIQVHRIRGVTIAGGSFAILQSGLAVKKGNVILLNEINRAIKTLREDGTISKIQKKWRPREILFLPRERVQIIVELAVGAFLVILIGAMTLWVITLKKQIRVRKKVESALGESEERYRRFVQMSAEGVWRLNLDPPVPVTLDERKQAELFLLHAYPVECNDAYARSFGYDNAAELLGAHLHVYDVFGGSHEEMIGIVLRFIRSGYRITDLDVLNRDREGKLMWGLSNVVGIVENGHLVSAWGARRDITQRKQAEEALIESKAFLNSIVDSTSDLIWSFEPMHYSLLTFNRAYSDHFLATRGIRVKIGLLPEDMLPVEVAKLWREWYHRVLREGPYNMEYLTHDGSRMLELSFNILQRDDVVYAVSVFGKDITERKQAEEALRQTETRYRTLFESAQDAIFLMQGERFVDCNPLTLRMFGCRREQIIGETPMRFSPTRQPDGRNSASKAREKIDAALSGNPQRFEWRHCRLDGKEFEAEISLNRLELDAQPMLLAIVRDITERKEAAEALHALVKATAGSGQDFFRALVIELAKVLHVKYAFVGALLPGAPERVRTVAMWAEDALAPNFEYELANAPCANVVNRDLCYYPDNVQTQFPEDKSLVKMGVVSYMGVPLFDASGAALGILAVLNDRPMESSELARSLLTILASRAATEMERQQSEEEIRHLLARVQEDAAELEKRVAERTIQLKAANAELEAFAYSVSHDLKAPLRGIDGYSRLLLEDYAPKLDENGRFFVHTIRKATGQMALLIDDLLAYSRLERRTMKANSIHLHSFVDALLANYSVEVQTRGVTLKVSIPETTVQADTDGLAMALRNLLENALKFTRKTPAPAIEIGGRETERSCILWVKDNGIGFDMRYHDRIFEIFQRLQRAENYPGTGIGLAMVRKSMERMGGRVWAESKPGEGAAFYLEVPQ